MPGTRSQRKASDSRNRKREYSDYPFSDLFAHTCSYIHWVGESASKSSPIKAEVRVYHQLFKSEDPSAHQGGFLADLNPESEQIFQEAKLEIGFEEIRLQAPWPKEAGETAVSSEGRPESVRFQGMRVGYFCVDKDSTSAQLVLNQITGLKDSAGKDQ
jgi:glutaminyl-tRNA synthetase